MLIFTLAIVGLMTSLTAGSRVMSDAMRLEAGIAMAQREMEAATTVSADAMIPSSGTQDLLSWTVSYAAKPHGLAEATVVVNWTSAGVGESYRLTRIFVPRQ